MAVLLETTMGDIVIDLYPEERPRCCLNFLKLCKMKYYNFNIFHSVQRNFMAQTGDPSGTGSGGQSIYGHIKGESARFFDMESHPRIKHKKKGSISMVNNGSNQHGSQFFITLREDIDYLDGIHTVFGEVTEGFDVLDKISETFCDSKHRPLQDIRISHTVILDDPFDDPKDLEFPDKSPEIDPYQLKSDRIAADEDVGKEKEKNSEEIEEEAQMQEAKANAQILEMVGDLPDADVKPPENVLFVCKLNPVTTSEDLEIIFSRFGKISSCEVIKDQATGDSLCYAFVEFERDEDCEEAYFKMDNVLIDDRRIHVDFSQSVAKLQFKGRGPVMPQRSTNSQASHQSRRGAERSRFSGSSKDNKGGVPLKDIPRKIKDQRQDDASSDTSSSSSSSSSPERKQKREKRHRVKSDKSRQRREEQERQVRRRDRQDDYTEGKYRRDEDRRERGRDRRDEDRSERGRDRWDEDRSERGRDRRDEDRSERGMDRRDEDRSERGMDRQDEDGRDRGRASSKEMKRMDKYKQEVRKESHSKEQQSYKRQERGRSSSTETSKNKFSSRKSREGRSDKHSSKDEIKRETKKRRSLSTSEDSSPSSVDRRKSRKRRDRYSSGSEDDRMKKTKTERNKKDERKHHKKERNRRSRSLSS